MKSKAIIISFLVFALIGAFKLKAHAQNGHPRISNTILLADETTLNYCKTEAIIECDNETIFNKIFLSHSQLFKRFTCTWIHRKKYPYKHYVIYMDRGDAQILINWAKKNL